MPTKLLTMQEPMIELNTFAIMWVYCQPFPPNTNSYADGISCYNRINISSARRPILYGLWASMCVDAISFSNNT